MKKLNLFVIALLSVSLMFTSCDSLNRAAKGGLLGAGGGAALGAGIGGLIGKDGKSAAIGAAIGGAVGATVGTVVGKKMDKAAEEAKRIQGAQVDDFVDLNGLPAIRVTFDSGILFDFNKSSLKQEAQDALAKFAEVLSDNPTMDVGVFGHTDNVGSLAANKKVSKDRATAVANHLIQNGAGKEQIKSIEGLDFSAPVASNETVEGRALNRRVEVYIYASEAMIKDAEEEVANSN